MPKKENTEENLTDETDDRLRQVAWLGGRSTPESSRYDIRPPPSPPSSISRSFVPFELRYDALLLIGSPYSGAHLLTVFYMPVSVSTTRIRIP